MRPSSLVDMALLAIPLLQGVATRRAAPKLLRVTVLGIVSGLLAVAILMAMFYAGYSILILYQFTPLCALLLMILLAVMILLGCLAAMRATMRDMKRAALPSADGLNRLLDAFLDGLGTSSPKK